MHQNNTPSTKPSVGKGYQPLREGHQPARTLNSTPPQGGSGVPAPVVSTPAAAYPTSPAPPSGNNPLPVAQDTHR